MARRASFHGLHNHARRQELDNDLVACRICGGVLIGAKALLEHTELHMFVDEAATKRQLLLSHLSPALLNLLNTTRFKPILPSSSGIINTGSYPPHHLQRAAVAVTPSASPIYFGLGNNPMPLQPTVTYGGGATASRMVVQRPRNPSFTRPFLNQLEANLLMEGMSRVVDLEMDADDDDEDGDEQGLDLNLKLGIMGDKD